MRPSLLAVLLLVAGLSPAFAQDSAAPAPAQDTDTLDPTPPGTLHPQPLPPLANPDAPSTPAKELFGRVLKPYPGPALPIGSYADGCLAGAVALPITGPAWQVMRLSRDRNWGTPRLIQFIERFGANAKKVGWNGLLIGDMSQPRGGPMISGHASHQIGLDSDIWFTPMPDHVLSREEREMDGAVDMVAPDRLGVDPKVWTHTRTELIRTASEDPDVTRIFVNAAIKKQMCSEAGADRGWLAKVGRGGATPSTSMSGSLARRTTTNARTSRRCRKATAAAMRSIIGSRNRRCTRRRRQCRRSRGRR